MWHMKALSMYTMVSTLSGDVMAGLPNPTVDAWAELTFSPEYVRQLHIYPTESYLAWVT